MSDRKLGLTVAIREELDRLVGASDDPIIYYVGPPADRAGGLRDDWMRRGDAIAAYITDAKGIPYVFDADAKVVRPESGATS